MSVSELSNNYPLPPSAPPEACEEEAIITRTREISLKLEAFAKEHEESKDACSKFMQLITHFDVENEVNKGNIGMSDTQEILRYMNGICAELSIKIPEEASDLLNHSNDLIGHINQYLDNLDYYAPLYRSSSAHVKTRNLIVEEFRENESQPFILKLANIFREKLNLPLAKSVPFIKNEPVVKAFENRFVITADRCAALGQLVANKQSGKARTSKIINSEMTFFCLIFLSFICLPFILMLPLNVIFGLVAALVVIEAFALKVAINNSIKEDDAYECDFIKALLKFSEGKETDGSARYVHFYTERNNCRHTFPSKKSKYLTPEEQTAFVRAYTEDLPKVLAKHVINKMSFNIMKNEAGLKAGQLVDQTVFEKIVSPGNRKKD